MLGPFSGMWAGACACGRHSLGVAVVPWVGWDMAGYGLAGVPVVDGGGLAFGRGILFVVLFRLVLARDVWQWDVAGASRRRGGRFHLGCGLALWGGRVYNLVPSETFKLITWT